MDATELLAREDEFKRLNKQLEKKTESLMKEIEQHMQKQDFFTVFSPSLSSSEKKKKIHCCTPPTPAATTPVHRPIRKKSLNIEPSSKYNTKYEYFINNNTQNDSNFENNTKNKRLNNSEFENTQSGNKNKTQNVICACCPREKNDDMEFLYAFVSVNIKDKVLPPSFSKEKVSVESVCKFLSSKVQLMQEQIDKLQSVIDRKSTQCEGHLTQLAELESERLALLTRTNSMRSSTADMRAKYMALQKRLEEKEKQYTEQRSECSRLSAALKQAGRELAGAAGRGAAAQQAAHALRQTAEQAHSAEKELRDTIRTLTKDHQSTTSRLESQIKSLVSRGDRQAALIDNLRKQNLLLATDGAVRCLERDYCNFLSQDL